MIARAGATIASLLVCLAAAGCTSYYEITIETPIKPKIDVSPFQRVFVAGFIAGGTEEVDANIETVRLLRSQLRTKSDLRVIEADAIDLMAVASKSAQARAAEDKAEAAGQPADQEAPKRIRDEKDLEPYDHVFVNVDYWKKIGEEFQQPLIVTGTILFTPHSQAGYVQREQEVYDAFGRRVVQPVRTYMERRGYILRPRFIFIDGRTGTTLYAETYREQVLYSPQQNTPALSSYFELMDRLIPNVLGTLSSQKIRGSRILLR